VAQADPLAPVPYRFLLPQLSGTLCCNWLPASNREVGTALLRNLNESGSGPADVVA
jgi:hypothetical protein